MCIDHNITNKFRDHNCRGRERDQSLQDKAPKHYWHNKTRQKNKQTNKQKQTNKTKNKTKHKTKQNKKQTYPHTKYINQIKDEETQTKK